MYTPEPGWGRFGQNKGLLLHTFLHMSQFAFFQSHVKDHVIELNTTDILGDDTHLLAPHHVDLNTYPYADRC